MHTPLVQTWDLDVLFPGGSESDAFKSYLSDIEKQGNTLQQLILRLKPPKSSADTTSLQEIVELAQNIALKLRQAASFVHCLSAQDMHDKKAVQLGGKVKTLSAQYANALTQLDQVLLQIDEEVWQSILSREPFAALAFPLNERRLRAKEKLPAELEALANDLAVDGYHGWSDLYDTVVSKMTIQVEMDGEQKELSVGQAFNKLSDPNRQVRQHVFQKWQEAWAESADFCADALNHLAGFRLNLYKHRGWDSVHKEPLDINRMSAETLQVMWQVIEQNKGIFVQYLERKAKLLGLKKLSWYDVEAPLEQTQRTISYDDAAQFIVEQFNRFSPKMADFAVHAFENRWIEAEDRPGKRPGGFCTSFPDSKQTRIFMTYAGTAGNVATLAHELGHAFHQHVMNDLPPLTQRYAMNVAETASTFAELIVADAALKHAVDHREKLALLEDKVQRAVAFFMNIHARFLFETRFYEERKQGIVSVERLNEIMVEAQKEAYCDALGEYEPHFWASKLHFYITTVPFYNFPYTFGYLFSAGIYARALEEGRGFEENYIALLRDTGRMQVEDLAQKHLGVDLTKPDFWQSAINLAVQDAQAFLDLTST
ncbi:oligoendopeptidase, pepF/M3 family [Caldalkalibacillus thermarum TA2.A1]|uniref:M3 family oligoendopeptidase n=1 Tax=Caldalkalibacillus thermarum (strain TA2.A1) TaxID=986075 RepID=F5L697_CALTT|nr:M3 family oligoendopeptidase [Caldalkalibacillus thermarum]EGL83147.1 oligoendopeptidase, pepF/M3 family [Caldalkalibacillus thermarum TA2.A1]QZT34844.1 M3 family oligoendopeptidase [Caldalkalibacillus thermarum TA2.A1]